MEWFWITYWGALGIIGAGFTVCGLVGIAVALLNLVSWLGGCLRDWQDRWQARRSG